MRSTLDKMHLARFTDYMTTTGDKLAKLTATRTELLDAVAKADMYWRWEIQRQIKAGVPVSEIAEVAGISKARVYQIRDGRR
jgi:hypothetical protein